MQRILKVDYEFPPQVRASKECRDILGRILVAEPKRRITIPEIQRHPWYQKDLPPGVVDMNDNLPPPSPNAQVRSAPGNGRGSGPLQPQRRCSCVSDQSGASMNW